MVKNYFEVLGFSKSEIYGLLRDNKYETRIKKRYRGLIKKLHPDRIRSLNLPKNLDLPELSDICTLIGEIYEAYEILSNPDKRRTYLAEFLLLNGRSLEFERTKMESLFEKAKLSLEFYKDLCQ